MKNNILIVGATFQGNDAVSNILSSLFYENVADDVQLYFLGYSKKNNETVINNHIYDYSLSNPFDTSLGYRGLRKLYSILHIDDRKLSTYYIYNKINRIGKNVPFSLIISASGRYCYSFASYYYAKKHNIELKIIYFDPFANNVYAINKRKRRKEEQAWINYASKIYYNAENLIPDEAKDDNIFSPFKIPVITRKQINTKKENVILYGGTFYSGIREPDGLGALEQQILGSGITIRCYSNISSVDWETNIEFLPLISSKEFKEKCQSAKALIYIGNIGGNSTSSKYLEYISLKKPIIGINVSESDEVRKYPYYIDCEGGRVLELLESIDEEALLEFNPNDVYPDRNAQRFARELLKIEGR